MMPITAEQAAQKQKEYEADQAEESKRKKITNKKTTRQQVREMFISLSSI
jgi:hypothetical protein